MMIIYTRMTKSAQTQDVKHVAHIHSAQHTPEMLIGHLTGLKVLMMRHLIPQGNGKIHTLYAQSCFHIQTTHL